VKTGEEGGAIVEENTCGGNAASVCPTCSRRLLRHEAMFFSSESGFPFRPSKPLTSDEEATGRGAFSPFWREAEEDESLSAALPPSIGTIGAVASAANTGRRAHSVSLPKAGLLPRIGERDGANELLREEAEGLAAIGFDPSLVCACGTDGGGKKGVDAGDREGWEERILCKIEGVSPSPIVDGASVAGADEEGAVDGACRRGNMFASLLPAASSVLSLSPTSLLFPSVEEESEDIGIEGEEAVGGERVVASSRASLSEGLPSHSVALPLVWGIRQLLLVAVAEAFLLPLVGDDEGRRSKGRKWGT